MKALRATGITVIVLLALVVVFGFALSQVAGALVHPYIAGRPA